MIRVTSLVENTTKDSKFETEHGLSLYIETPNHHILFDMGQSDLFAKNAQKLGIDLTKVDIAILSHGHYDHGGGLKTFLEINQTASVYLNEFAFEPHYHGNERYIGLDTSLLHHERLIFTNDLTTIDTGLTLYTCNNCEKQYHLGSFGLTLKQNDVFLPDDFRHEQYLLIEEQGKRILISGCSHKGIMDITQWFQPNVLIGGFHFSKLPLDATLMEYAKYLDTFDTDFYTCHCTGIMQYEFMKTYMNRLDYLPCGETIKI